MKVKEKIKNLVVIDISGKHFVSSFSSHRILRTCMHNESLFLAELYKFHMFQNLFSIFQISGRRSTIHCRIRTLKSVLKQCSCRTACTCVKTSPAIPSPSTLKHAPVSSAKNTRHTMTSRSVNQQMLLQWIDINTEV